MTATLLVGSLLSAGCQTADAPRREVAQHLDALFSDLHARGLFDGAVVVGLGRDADADIAYAGGFGFANREANERWSADTPGDTGSLRASTCRCLRHGTHTFVP